VFLPQRFGLSGKQKKCSRSGKGKNELWFILPNGGVSDSRGNSADYGMCIFCVAIRGLEKEQEGLVNEVNPQIRDLWERVSQLEAEVRELKKKQWSIGPLTEPIEVIGSYHTTVGAGIGAQTAK
jgi:hypothetical protein